MSKKRLGVESGGEGEDRRGEQKRIEESGRKGRVGWGREAWREENRWMESNRWVDCCTARWIMDN